MPEDPKTKTMEYLHPCPAQEKHVFSVGEISSSIKKSVEQYTDIEVKGEISGLKRHSSGHVYFALKDDAAVLDAVMWKFVAAKMTIDIADGMEVICRGRITTYPNRSKYQMCVDNVSHSGTGSLLKMLEERKTRLLKEGLFAQERKRRLPFLPERIGIITSPTGAVIQDMLHRISERLPSHVILWPVNVQGTTASEEIIRAIHGIQTHNPSIIIIARGGGSIEDLWPFNDESLVRAVASCPIPIISAIGHETDTTLIDYAADVRAPTPTAAAEMAVPVRQILLDTITATSSRIKKNMENIVGMKAMELRSYKVPKLEDTYARMAQYADDLEDRIKSAFAASIQKTKSLLDVLAARIGKGPKKEIDMLLQKLSSMSGRILPLIQRAITMNETKISSYAKFLDAVSYKKILERGFALVEGHDGIIKSKEKAIQESKIDVIFHDGRVSANIEK